MNTTCCPPSNTVAAAPTASNTGVTENLQKPRFQIERQENAFVVRVDLPGVPKSGVKIEFHEDVLSIRGERAAALPAEWKPLHQEISMLNYQLRLHVNTPVDDERLTATLEDGVLSLTLPMKATAMPRQISVN